MAQAAMAVGEDNEGRYFKKVVGTGVGAGGASYIDPFQSLLIEGSAAAGGVGDGGIEIGTTFQIMHRQKVHWATAVKQLHHAA